MVILLPEHTFIWYIVTEIDDYEVPGNMVSLLKSYTYPLRYHQI